MQSKNITWNVIVRYLEREESPEELQAIRQWKAADPEHEEFIAYLEGIWSSDAEVKEEWNADAAWNRFQEEYGEVFQEQKLENVARLESNAAKTRQKSYFQKSSKRNGYLWWGSVAAAIGLLVVILFFTYQNGPQSTQPLAMKKIVCPNGRHMQLHLGDGSWVTLNGGSKISLPKSFPEHGRHVKLDGEAFFRVVHNAENPFIVETRFAKIKDIGTRFDVKAYPGDSTTTVAVVEGKVSFHSKNASGGSGTLITGLHKGVLRQNSIRLSAIKDTSAYVGWTRGNLVFNNDSFAKVAAKLERWYDINVKAGNIKMLKQKFTGKFTASQPIDEVLDAIALTLNMTYSRHDSTIIFHRNNTK